MFPGTENTRDWDIYATGDGGETWHCVYSSSHDLFSINHIVGIPTKNGQIIGRNKDSSRIVYFDKLTWE